MTIREAGVANPPALPSRIPEESLLLAAHFPTPALNAVTAEFLAHFTRAANFIAADKRGLFYVTMF